ncbi:hypothetical protein GGS26DRAFT_276971 [Hypomontagnella submonticulosa]|nr:hypothetical protein GGS26DRAFT_276971 [Hypomontagnella submonticulosa]
MLLFADGPYVWTLMRRPMPVTNVTHMILIFLTWAVVTAKYRYGIGGYNVLVLTPSLPGWRRWARELQQIFTAGPFRYETKGRPFPGLRSRGS